MFDIKVSSDLCQGFPTRRLLHPPPPTTAVTRRFSPPQICEKAKPSNATSTGRTCRTISASSSTNAQANKFRSFRLASRLHERHVTSRRRDVTTAAAWVVETCVRVTEQLWGRALVGWQNLSVTCYPKYKKRKKIRRWRELGFEHVCLVSPARPEASRLFETGNRSLVRA